MIFANQDQLNRFIQQESKDAEEKITIGSKVRSFDFRHRDITGDRACYVEGVVVDILKEENNYDRYLIKVHLQVFGGIEKFDFPPTVTPPVNGTLTMFGDTTNFVEPIQ